MGSDEENEECMLRRTGRPRLKARTTSKIVGFRLPESFVEEFEGFIKRTGLRKNAVGMAALRYVMQLSAEEREQMIGEVLPEDEE